MKQKPRPLKGFHRRNVRENKPTMLWPKTRQALERAGKGKSCKNTTQFHLGYGTMEDIKKEVSGRWAFTGVKPNYGLEPKPQRWIKERGKKSSRLGVVKGWGWGGASPAH